MKYNIEFYEYANGNSEIWNYLEELRLKSTKNVFERKRKKLRAVKLIVQKL